MINKKTTTLSKMAGERLTTEQITTCLDTLYETWSENTSVQEELEDAKQSLENALEIIKGTLASIEKTALTDWSNNAS